MHVCRVNHVKGMHGERGSKYSQNIARAGGGGPLLYCLVNCSGTVPFKGLIALLREALSASCSLI